MEVDAPDEPELEADELGFEPQLPSPDPPSDPAGLQAPAPAEAGASRLAAPEVGEVELTAARWQQLRPDVPHEPGPLLVRREVRLRAVEGGVDVTARYWLWAAREGWFANQLLGPEAHLRRATWNGRDATVWSGGQGPLLVERFRGEATLEVHAFVPGRPSDGLSLMLLGAPRGTVALEGLGEDVELTGDERPVVARDGVLHCGATTLHLAPRVPAPRDRGPLSVASVGLGVTVGDAEVRGRARLRWEIRQGTREALQFTATGVGEDLTVEGPQVGRWTRAGDEVRVELTGPVTGRVDLDVRWSKATPPGAEAALALPSLVPADVFRSAVAVQVARDGEV
ncbi:MAG: hypothetical protein KDK70_28815, partial [Myxococcales bacterium]|nr:hypothetical protein [Myxococcales bacterium]